MTCWRAWPHVTVVRSGGVGNSAAAVALEQQLMEDFAGMFFVDLSMPTDRRHRKNGKTVLQDVFGDSPRALKPCI